MVEKRFTGVKGGRGAEQSLSSGSAGVTVLSPVDPNPVDPALCPTCGSPYAVEDEDEPGVWWCLVCEERVE
jgi:hypothetical protein